MGLSQNIRDLTLDYQNGATPHGHGVPAILAALEEQLAALDQSGAWIAAAHLDCAIQQLRLDQVRR
jgi:hypothetical protein